MTKIEEELKEELKKINGIISALTEKNQKIVSSKEERTLWTRKREIIAKLNPLNKNND